jgi:FKBP-type peptidyl-prolyl cis-trans isomerase SlyD
MAEVVQKGKVVSLAYTLRLANGEMIDHFEADDPLEYLHGAENIVPGLERELTGLRVGDTKEVEVAPVDGYGVYDPDDVEVIERSALPKNLPLKLGMVLGITDDEGNMSEAVVREISAKAVTLDFNHPLAGQKLFFSVEVLDVRDATEDELAHGHPHGDDGLDEFDEFEELGDDDFEDLLDFDDEEFDEEDFEDDDEDDDDFDDLEDFEEDEDDSPSRRTR